MIDRDFYALVVEEQGDSYVRGVQSRNTRDLPLGDLLVKVSYSSLNYKDALSASGNKGVTKQYPHTPGIDAAGIIVYSDDAAFRVGDPVIVTGYDLGMNTDGGFGQYIRIPSEWAVRLPAGLTLREAMMFGTAGFTAGISVSRLIAEVSPASGEILVSGATGGVGSMSVAILSKLGYRVVALTGKTREEDYLKHLGAHRILPRQQYGEASARPLLQSQWAGAIDTVGGTILENILKSTRPYGIVTCCGNVASAHLNLTVYPFILRGISLVGIDSQNYPMGDRQALWQKLAGDWKPDGLADMCNEKTLDALDACIDLMLAGRLKGRVLVNMEKP